MGPEQINAALEEANRLLEAGNPDECLRQLDSLQAHVVELDDRIECAALRAYALAELGRIEEALELLEGLLEQHPDSPRLYGAMGVVLSNDNDLEAARQALENAVALDAQDETLLGNLALVYEKLNDYETASRLYDQAIAQGADLDWALQRKAFVLTEAGSTAEARATIRRYLSLVPDDADQWIALAILHSDDAQYDEACNCYREAERIAPDSAGLRLNWGVTAVRSGNLALARRQLAELRRVAPDSMRPLLLHAFILEEQGNLRAARHCYREALTRVDETNRAELTYVLEMAMDFFARGNLRERCERLLQRAYAANACTVELCEPYRELSGVHVARGFWFNLVVEADFRDGLCAVYEEGAESGPHQRYQRNFQVVARNHDEATEIVLDFMARAGEAHVSVREFVREEAFEDFYTGIYEIERESLVLGSA